MRFDITIGNPPYQEDSNTGSKQRGAAGALWPQFVTTCQPISNTMCMIVPSRWAQGGKGISDKFRSTFISQLNTLIHNGYSDSWFDMGESKSIAGGISIFIIKYNEHPDTIDFYNEQSKEHLTYPKSSIINNTFITSANMANIFAKVYKKTKTEGLLPLSDILVTPDGTLKSNLDYTKLEHDSKGLSDILNIITTGGNGSREQNIYKISARLLNIAQPTGYRVGISTIGISHNQGDKRSTYEQPLPILATMFVMDPDSTCSVSYMTSINFETRLQAENLIKYLKTRFVRSLLDTQIIGFHCNKNCYDVVPYFDLTSEMVNGTINDIDEALYKYFELSESEINYIKTTIKELT